MLSTRLGSERTSSRSRGIFSQLVLTKTLFSLITRPSRTVLLISGLTSSGLYLLRRRFQKTYQSGKNGTELSTAANLSMNHYYRSTTHLSVIDFADHQDITCYSGIKNARSKSLYSEEFHCSKKRSWYSKTPEIFGLNYLADQTADPPTRYTSGKDMVQKGRHLLGS